MGLDKDAQLERDGFYDPLSPWPSCHLCGARFYSDNDFAIHTRRHRDLLTGQSMDPQGDYMTIKRQAHHTQETELREMLDELRST